jgi:hypothetical protein
MDLETPFRLEVDGVRISLSEYCAEHGLGSLLDQWDEGKNGELSPDSVSYGSQRKVWWRCGAGHSWQTAVYARTSGAGCPYCTGRRVAPGDNDLATERPDLASQWHPVKNQDLTPRDVSAGSHKVVWWLCQAGHEWQASVRNRTNGTGCPVCAGKAIVPGENDLATAFPGIAEQWHPTKNGSLTPRDISIGSRKKIWWQCEKGHEWQAFASTRVQGSGCPVCAGKVVIPGFNDLASAFPEIAGQWHPTKNGSLTPDQLTPASNRKVWWRCQLGHDYTSAVSDRTGRNTGCPYCAGRKVLVGFNDLATVEPRVAEQWHPTLNGKLLPEMVTAGCHRKVWWQCMEGHVWKAMIYSRTGPGHYGCPVCAGHVKKLSYAGRAQTVWQERDRGFTIKQF